MATYTPPSISNYNDNPPTDDGSTNFTDNGVSWERHIDEIGDPLNNYIDAVNSAAESGFDKVDAARPTSVTDFGATGDGVTDDTASIQSALDSLTSGGALYFPGGNYLVASATLGATGLSITNDDVNIYSDGDATITITGTDECALFVASDVSRLTIKSMVLVGNSQCTQGSPYGTAIVIDNIGSTGAISDFVVSSNRISGFSGDMIVRVERDVSADYNVSKVWIRNNSISGSGSRDYADSGVASAAIYVTANDIVGGSSYLEDVWIEDNTIDGTNLKQGVEIISNNNTRVNLRDVYVKGNVIKDAGANASALYGYGISLYGYVQRSTVAANRIIAPRHSGIYMASPFDVVVDSNIIEGQLSGFTVGSLARGGIGITTASNFVLSNNTIRDCVRGIDCLTDASNYDAPIITGNPTVGSVIIGNSISDCSEYGINATPRGERISIIGNSINTPDADYGVYSLISTAAQDYELTVSNNGQIIGLGGVYVSVVDGLEYVKDVNISGNSIYSTTSNGVQWVITNGTNIKVSDNVIIGDKTASVYGVRGSNTSGTIIHDNTVQDYDVAFRLNTVTGSLEGNSTRRCTTIISNNGNDFGQDTPAWGNWSYGAIIQKLDPAAGGSIGWVMTTAGTFGTLNGGATTGSITTGTNALSVNSNTDLTLDSHITIAGVTGVKIVTKIDGTDITLDTNADATVAGAAVAFSTPVAKTYGSITA